MRRFAATVVTAALTFAALVAPASTSVAAETYVWPLTGTLQLEGRGYGHGHGMSQWGALGAARSGLAYGQILRHYYPGTTLVTRSSPWLRVWSTGAGTAAATVNAEAGLSLVTATWTVALPSAVPAGTVSRWRLVRSGTALALQAFAGGGWHGHATPAPLGTSAVFRPSDGVVTEVRGSVLREHRGELRGLLDGTTVRTVVLVPLEQYLRSVVAAEMPTSWDLAALRAQAVAARTYAMWERSTASGWYDTCDTTQCQVYKGAASTSGGTRTVHETARSDTAVRETAGRILEYAGAPAFTQFSASNGGWAAAGSRPYLKAFADPYDGAVPSTAHSWTASVERRAIESRYPALGTLTSVRVLARDGNGEWGGRVRTLELVGTAGSVEISGDAFRSAAGLRSTWWRPRISGTAGQARDYDGDRLPDLLATRADGTLWLYSGNGLGGFLDQRQIGHGWSGVHLVPVGDLNDDDEPDVVAWTDDGTLWLYAGTGRGWFRPRVQIGHGWRSVQALTGVGDLDGDGHDDLVATFTDGTLWLFPGTGRGWFQPKRPIGHGWRTVDTLVGPGDFDGDGHVDVVARENSGRLWLYRGNGRGWFGRTDPVGTGWGGVRRMLSPGDWNGDGWPDVLAVYDDGRMRLFPGNGRGWFGPSTVVATGWQSFIDVV